MYGNFGSSYGNWTVLEPAKYAVIRRPVDREFIAQMLVESVIEDYNTSYKKESRPLTSWQKFVQDFFARNRGCHFSMSDCATAYWASKAYATDDEVTEHMDYEPVNYETPEDILINAELNN